MSVKMLSVPTQAVVCLGVHVRILFSTPNIILYFGMALYGCHVHADMYNFMGQVNMSGRKIFH